MLEVENKAKEIQAERDIQSYLMKQGKNYDELKETNDEFKGKSFHNTLSIVFKDTNTTDIVTWKHDCR